MTNSDLAALSEAATELLVHYRPSFVRGFLRAAEMAKAGELPDE